ncbi:pre-mRNA 3'-end-processing factor FIP1 isoform X2 [Sebastes umbrosus]|uniref:pre-mRNA 3'-end-processing factor FIP1 isoform X2 n=1 Tax=Sebastes umbrosus TaxID=72105 RepID=UPI0018A0FF94|nr:pre-mRNA 3'-end-processing factor FIP1 isoform X2 [Sebastes umbrosus]
MYSSWESESEIVQEEDEEGKLYQWIYEMTTEDKEETEEVQIPTSSGNVEADAGTSAEAVVTDTRGRKAKTKKAKTKKGKTKKGKPWRRAGADISDYFNYGFNEESWNIYHDKQAKVRAANRKPHTKTTVQKGSTRHEEEEESRPVYPSSTLTSRHPSDVIGGRPGSGGRVEGRRRRRQHLSDEGNNSQTATEASPEEDRFTSHHRTAPSEFNSLFAFTAPPTFLYQSGPPPPSQFAALDSGLSKGSDDPSTSPQPCSSGVSSVIPKSLTSRAGMMDTARAWERYIWQEKCDRDRDRDSDRSRSRSREHGRGDKDNSRGRDRDRDRDKGSGSSSHSVEERTRQRDTAQQRGRKRHSDRPNGEKEEWHGEKRNRNHGEERQKPSCSSRRRDGGKDRDTLKKKKDKKTNKKERKCD